MRARPSRSRSTLGPFDALRIEEHVHGHLGWLAAVALMHPAIVLRRPLRRAHMAVALAVAVVTLAAAFGAWIYPHYRDTLRQPIFASSPALGYLFERKEHLAFGAVMLSWAGAATYGAATVAAPELREPLWRTAHRAFVAAAVLATVAASLGTVVAAYRTF